MEKTLSILTENEINKIKTYLSKKLTPYLIMLFGSAVKGNMRKDSDVDLAFLSDKDFSSYELYMISQGMADLLEREVHLVDLAQASTVFQAQVVGTGKVLYCTDENRRKIFNMITLKKYAQLNEERKVILDKIKERGNVYGR